MVVCYEYIFQLYVKMETLLSLETDATRVPWVLKLTSQTASLWLLSIWIHWREETSHNFTDLSAEPDTKLFPSGEAAMDKTHDVWPENESINCLLVTSYMCIKPSSEAVYKHFESGEKHTLRTGNLWPSNCPKTFPLYASKRATVQLVVPHAMYLPLLE